MKVIQPETLQKYNTAAKLIQEKKQVKYNKIKQILGTVKTTELFLTSYENRYNHLLYEDDGIVGIYEHAHRS
jgi:hypothetical protein